jgi:phage tail sheath protein FI
MTANLAPGVHVKEVERGAKPIEGVSTSTAGFLGPTERGPEEPRLVTSYADYQRLYGGYVEGSNLAPAVEGFFTNGGSRAYVGRVTGAEETANNKLRAGSTLADPGTQEEVLWSRTEVLDFCDDSSGTKKTITVKNIGASSHAAIGITEADLEIEADDDVEEDVWSVATAAGGDVSVDAGKTADIEVTFDGLPGDTDKLRRTLKIPHDGKQSPLEVELRAGTGVMEVTAVGPGEWGEHVVVIVEDATMYTPGENDLFRLTIRYWADEDDLEKARTYHGDPEHAKVPDPDVEEVYDDLSPVESSSQYYESVVNAASNLVNLEREQPGRPTSTVGGPTWLGDNLPDDYSDPEIERGDYEGDATLEPDKRTGFAGFGTVDGISIICVPDEHGKRDYWLTDLIRNHCVNEGDRFGITTAPRNPGPPSDVRPDVNSDFTAYYYPWIEIISSETGNEKMVPPGGHIAGIYARSDGEHGVHKAPANEVIRGAQSVQMNLTDGDQAPLNARGVNCIRSFRGRGIRVWGARTTSPNPSWKYLNVRRLFLYLEESIDEGTQWVVFESNDEDLWARVEQTIENFLTAVWEDGALMGSTPEEAFYVKCDRTTMTQNDIDNGRLICEIGVAPVKPAEFVIFEIGQWTGSAE